MRETQQGTSSKSENRAVSQSEQDVKSRPCDWEQRVILWVQSSERARLGHAPVLSERQRECLTQQVDDPLVVGGEQTDGVFKKQHEGSVDHAVGELIRVGLETHTHTHVQKRQEKECSHKRPLLSASNSRLQRSADETNKFN